MTNRIDYINQELNSNLMFLANHEITVLWNDINTDYDLSLKCIKILKQRKQKNYEL
jgi:hypothetical protein